MPASLPVADLAALVVTLRPKETVYIKQHMGRAVHECFFSIITQFDPALAAYLHDDHEGAPKPFATTGLMSMPSNTLLQRHTITPGDTVWMRFVGLRASIVAALDAWVKSGPEEVELNYRQWDILQTTFLPQEHPWAGRATYAGLAAQHLAGPFPASVKIEFVTPTCFSSGIQTLPLPVPEMVFHSLFQQWNTFVELEPLWLEGDVRSYFETLVAISSLDISTASLEFERSIETGFAGKTEFALNKVNGTARRKLRRQNKTDLLQTLESQQADLARAVGLLASFSFYSGVGKKTTQGMGLVRPLGRAARR